ncbi:molybdenum cofactor guanylyltransferase MobA [Piscinibacter koreensis]|uniref:Molybdenum cofactor guanylyltransferase n=1 Tax=Piscinibacter koreensis TaxID=2742824 RepID=A0A7Y6TX87_9BURK|nr:molybdenum cofactor guanylyltransferase MobA [Schlegelella koreensis]
MIPSADITGLVVAGGRATRMGGVDKGLQAYRGMPLALHAVLRLAPQVGEVMINANRNLAAYESMGVPVWPDAVADYPGPLGGFMAGLERCETPYLATVPCDSPQFPTDLVARLAASLADADAEIAMAATRDDGRLQLQPVFCLMRTSVLESLVRFLHAGERKIAFWARQQRFVEVEFADPAAFANANTLDELRRLAAEG